MKEKEKCFSEVATLNLSYFIYQEFFNLDMIYSAEAEIKA